MASSVYSVNLIDEAPVGAGIFRFGPAPDGTRWVVRWVSFFNDVDWPGRLLGVTLQDTGAGRIAAVTYPDPEAQKVYAFEVHAIIPDGLQLELETLEGHWHVHVDGYQLRLP